MAAYVEPVWVGEMGRIRAMIEMRDRQRATEPARVYRAAEDERPAPDLGKAIAHHKTITRRKKGA